MFMYLPLFEAAARSDVVFLMRVYLLCPVFCFRVAIWRDTPKTNFLFCKANAYKLYVVVRPGADLDLDQFRLQKCAVLVR